MQASLGISPRRKVRKLDEESSSAANNDGEHDASNDARRGKLTKSARDQASVGHDAEERRICPSSLCE